MQGHLFHERGVVVDVFRVVFQDRSYVALWDFGIVPESHLVLLLHDDTETFNTFK